MRLLAGHWSSRFEVVWYLQIYQCHRRLNVGVQLYNRFELIFNAGF